MQGPDRVGLPRGRRGPCAAQGSHPLPALASAWGAALVDIEPGRTILIANPDGWTCGVCGMGMLNEALVPTAARALVCVPRVRHLTLKTECQL